jgi:hypothetical protein
MAKMPLPNKTKLEGSGACERGSEDMLWEMGDDGREAHALFNGHETANSVSPIKSKIVDFNKFFIFFATFLN